MDTRPSPVTARFLRTPDAAVHLGLSARTLEKHRCFGTGPVYRKLGGRIVYAVTGLDAWAEQGLRRSISDPGKGLSTQPSVMMAILRRSGAEARNATPVRLPSQACSA